MRYHRAALLVVVFLTFVDAASAQPRESAFSEFFEDAKLILIGRFEKAPEVKGRRQFNLTVSEVIRAHPKFTAKKGEKVANVDPQQLYFPLDKNCLILAFNSGDRWVYAPIWEADDRLVAYVRTVANNKDDARFYLDHLVDANKEIRDDVLLRLGRWNRAALVKAAKTLPREKAWAVVKNPKAQARLWGNEKDIAASLLAGSGKPEDADELFKLMPKKAYAPGYWLAILALKPKEYIPKAKALALAPQPPRGERDGLYQAVSDLYELNSPAVPQKDAVALMSNFLDQPDNLASWTIDDMRRWKRWEMTERILGLNGKKGYEEYGYPIIRFALRSPTPAARAFVAKMRKKDAATVKKVEEGLLEMERSER